MEYLFSVYTFNMCLMSTDMAYSIECSIPV